jgi:hypothetical protein
MTDEPKRRWVKRVLIVVGVFAGVVGALALVLFGIFSFLNGDFHPNKAHEAVAPMEQRLEALGGDKVCSSGYSGFGYFGGTVGPWYKAFWVVPNTDEAKKAFFDEASKHGYILLREDRDYGGPSDEFFNSVPEGGSGLGLEIRREVKLSDFCDGQTGAVSGDEAVLKVLAPEVSR